MAQLSQMSEFEVCNHLVDYFQSHLSGTTIWVREPRRLSKADTSWSSVSIPVSQSVGGLTTPDILVDSSSSIYLGLGDILWEFIVIMKYKSTNTGQTPAGQVRSRALGRGHAYLGHRVLLHFRVEKNLRVFLSMYLVRLCTSSTKTSQFVGR